MCYDSFRCEMESRGAYETCQRHNGELDREWIPGTCTQRKKNQTFIYVPLPTAQAWLASMFAATEHYSDLIHVVFSARRLKKLASEAKNFSK